MNNRERGKRGERDARDAIREHLGLPGCFRAAQSSGSLSADLGGTGGLHFEVKLRKSLAVYDFIEQAIKDSKGKKVPAVVMRRDRGEWLLMMRLSDTPSFIQSLAAAQQEQHGSMMHLTETNQYGIQASIQPTVGQ